MTNFKKNDAVAVIADWDRKGTVTIRRATVQAWGNKIARLIDAETGEMFKSAQDVANCNGPSYMIVADNTDAALEIVAMRNAETILEIEQRHFAHCLTIGAGEGYDNSIRRSIAALHEPRVVAYHVIRAAR